MPSCCANCAGMRLLKATARGCLFTSAIVLSEVDAKITMPQTGASPYNCTQVTSDDTQHYHLDQQFRLAHK